MKFKFYYYKSFEKSIHEKIDSMCSSINETQNEDIISCYIIDVSVFESNLWIEFRKKKIPENYEEYEEIIEVD